MRTRNSNRSIDKFIRNRRDRFDEKEFVIGYIYEIRNLITGQVYIGKTINIGSRRKKHMTNSDVKKVNRSVRGYGAENHTFTVVWSGVCNNDILNIAEKVYMDKYEGDPLCMNTQFYFFETSSSWYSESEIIKAKSTIELNKAAEEYWFSRWVDMFVNEGTPPFFFKMRGDYYKNKVLGIRGTERRRRYTK